MPSRLSTAAVVFGLLLVPALALAGQKWQPYVNDRFGVRADIPQGWVSGQPPENNDGLRWTSPDGTAQVAVWGGFQIEDGVDDAFKTVSAPNAGETITFKARGKQALVISGFKGENIFYRRLVLSCKNSVWNGVEITYPKAKKAEFDPIVSHIAASLKPGIGYNNPDCK